MSCAVAGRANLSCCDGAEAAGRTIMRRMLRLDRQTRRLAAALATLAGYVDAVGFLLLGGFFVSFMSGNSTRLAVGTADGAAYAATAFGLILVFLAGVSLGTWIARRAHRPRAVVLGYVAAILALAALLAGARHVTFAGFALALGMGIENAAFVVEGGLPVGLTYMTGTLVKLGQEIGAVRSAGDCTVRPICLALACTSGRSSCRRVDLQVPGRRGIVASRRRCRVIVIVRKILRARVPDGVAAPPLCAA